MRPLLSLAPTWLLKIIPNHFSKLYAKGSEGRSSGNAQEDYMLNDLCLLVDESDVPKGVTSKKHCHELTDGKSPIHRAFSLFLFRKFQSDSNDPQVQLLLQKRSKSKLTFPMLWSNTCCSHPIANFPHEMTETDALGVKRAAQRKIMDELGICADRFLPLSGIHFLTRIIYFAHNEHVSDQRWAEHEMDYILVSILEPTSNRRMDASAIHFNPEEVCDVKWINHPDLTRYLQTKQVTDDPGCYSSPEELSYRSFTPWIRTLFDAHILDSVWQWAEAYCNRDVSTNFIKEDTRWNRDTIIDLRD